MPLRPTAPGSATFVLEGEEEMVAKLRAIVADFPDKVVRALRWEAEQIMTKSKRAYVPVDLGVLKSSGHVEKAERKGKDVSVAMNYGGAAAPYALAIHEHPSPHSPPSWKGKGAEDLRSVRTGEQWSTAQEGGRGPKYLERPMNQATAGMAKRIARAVKP